MSACYRSNHADVMTVWDDTQRRYRETHAAIRVLRQRFDREAMVQRGGGSYRLAALTGAVPEGGELLWRQDRKAGGWVPRRNSKEGKALAKEWDACAARGLGEVPGLPHYVQVTGAGVFNMQGAAIFDQGGYLWACWSSVDHEDVLKSGWGTLDETLWEQVKRSELEAAKEAREEKVDA